MIIDKQLLDDLAGRCLGTPRLRMAMALCNTPEDGIPADAERFGIGHRIANTPAPRELRDGGEFARQDWVGILR